MVPDASIHTDANSGDSAVIDADNLVGHSGNQIEATGDATLSQGDQSIRADKLLYQQSSHDVVAQGSVVLEQNGNVLSGSRLLFNMDKHAGTMEQPQFYLKDNASRGSAEVLRIEDGQHYSLIKATYTTCPAGNQDWFLHMGTLDIDRDRQIGTASNAYVEFKSVPILYMPWMDFPTGNQSKSGFLAPTFGDTVKGGSELTLPYYWNIAPNLDATIAPRMISKRGLMLNDEFRYLEAGYGGEIHVDTLQNDSIANRSRELFSMKHSQAFTGKFGGYIDYNRVGDNNYFRDLGDTVNTTSQVNLLQEGRLNYNSDIWMASLRVQRYQTLQDPAAPIVEPYARLPQLTVGAQRNYSGLDIAFTGEYVDFSHPTLVNGSRVVFNPSVSYPLVKNSAFYLTPKVALHSTYYAMGANNSMAYSIATRSLPILSVDSGAAFERESNLFGGDYLQTFEPRAFYVYVPYKDQSMLPNFDSAPADFNFTQMFTENRFSGNDRIGDANQVTLAATSSLLDQNSGFERLKVMMGERFSLKASQVNLNTPASSSGMSNILLAAAGQVSKAWSLDSEFQYDPNQAHAQLYNVTTHYRPEPGKVFNLGYRYQRNTLRLIDLSTQWPMFSRWQMVGRWNYSLQDSRVLEATAGLEYNQSCWALRLVATHFTTATQQTNTGFFVQLELNDFVKVGSDPLTLLKQSVFGYTKMNDKSAVQAPLAVQ